VKFTAVLATVATAVVLQLALARFAVGGRWSFDLVLVGVVYAALNLGPVAGMLTGTAGGIIQDLLSDDVVGTGGLVKTLLGFATGAAAAQFDIARPSARIGLLALVSLLHRILMLGAQGLIEQHWPAFRFGAILWETLINSACGLVVFQTADRLPAFLDRRRQRRTSFRRREW